MDLTGKHVAILGVGRSGRAAAALALREGAKVSAWDRAGAEAVAEMPAGGGRSKMVSVSHGDHSKAGQ